MQADPGDSPGAGGHFGRRREAELFCLKASCWVYPAGKRDVSHQRLREVVGGCRPPEREGAREKIKILVKGGTAV